MKRKREEPEKTRGFVITNWNLDTKYEDLVFDENIEYAMRREASHMPAQIQFIAFGRETCPTSKKLHDQCFCYFINPRSTGKRALGVIGRMFGPIHANVLPMYGSFAQNEAYCSKEGQYRKLGNPPRQGTRDDLNEIKDAIMRGEIRADDVAVENPTMFHQYGRTLDRLEAIALRKKWRTEMTEGIWYTGVSGVGKSHKAFEGYNPDTHYVKNLNEDWWNGYKGQETIILNEFRGQIPFAELLDLMDKWPKNVKWRCRESVPFLAKRLIITSIKHPKDIYVRQEGEPWEQFDRRCKIVNLQESEQKCSEGNNGTSEPKNESV